jgi:glycyl-tRNA synthetase beta chain
MTTDSLLVEVFVEELPPKALNRLGNAFAHAVHASLVAQGLTDADAVVTPYASPRRLAAHIDRVHSQAPRKPVSHKLMPVSVGLDAGGNATAALLKKLAAIGQDSSVVAQLAQRVDGKATVLFFDSVSPGATLAQGLQGALDEALANLPIPKVMQYQLEDGWSTVRFVRPAHGLVALFGTDVVAVRALGLTSGRLTHGHRFEASSDPIALADADDYSEALRTQGAVIASFTQRRSEIAHQLGRAAAALGLTPVHDELLLDEVTALVERPNVLACRFEPEFLEVPPECLILTMKANQKYFPLLDESDKLTNQFLVVSNISPADPSRVVQGNERVVRPRLADAKFFFDQDRKRTLESRLPGLDKVVYHGKLGTQGQRSHRVASIAAVIARELGGGSLVDQAVAAARLAKADLLTEMVGEFPELQGVMGGYYARHDGQPDEVAVAIEDHYRPRFAGDQLPRNRVADVVALADKLETLVGLFRVGQRPSGDKDPFALRRHALGIVRILVEHALALDLSWLIRAAQNVFDAAAVASVDASAAGDVPVVEQVEDFIRDRLAGLLQEQGARAQDIDAVMSLRPQRLSETAARLAAVEEFRQRPEAAALAAANKRVANILKKVESAHAPAKDVDPALLTEPGEIALASALSRVAPAADQAFQRGDFTASLLALAALRGPVDAFFDAVMVNAQDVAVRANRLALLAALHGSMNQVADLAKLSG